MREEVLDDVVARQFLLGQLTPEEQGRVEELAFEDPNTFEFLESVENDLIDEFIQGDLSAAEQQQFESHFLTLPGRRKNLKLSRLLQHHLNSVPHVAKERKLSFFEWFKLQNALLKFSLTAAAIGLTVLALWVLLRAWEAKQPEPMQAGPDRPVTVPSPDLKVSPSLEPTSSPAHVENKPKSLVPEKQRKLPTYALLMPSGSVRSEDNQQLTLPRDETSVTIELPLITGRKFPRYEAVLENETGAALKDWPDLKQQYLTSGKAIKIDVPLTLLKPQERYRIVLSGVPSRGEKERIATYPFEAIQ